MSVGGERAHPARDVRDAGRLLAVAFADASPDADELPRVEGVDWLAEALTGVFDPDPGARPTARVVLSRLKALDRLVPVRERGEALAAGRRRFDERRGRAPSAAVDDPHDVEDSRESVRGGARSGVSISPAVIVVVVLLVAAVVVVLFALKLASS